LGLESPETLPPHESSKFTLWPRSAWWALNNATNKLGLITCDICVQQIKPGSAWWSPNRCNKLNAAQSLKQKCTSLGILPGGAQQESIPQNLCALDLIF